MSTPGMSKKKNGKKKDGQKEKKTSDKDSNEENKNEGEKLTVKFILSMLNTTSRLSNHIAKLANELDNTCAFCGIAEDNERLYGKMIVKSGLTVHYFCMLFSSALNQRGRSDKQGILGFLIDDIKRELRRGAKLRCHFCKKPGATIGCALPKCGRKFHLHCGLNNETLNQFFGSFCVFCADHRPKQIFPESPSTEPEKTNCLICLGSIERKLCFQILRTPCCKNAWFHRRCVQDQALNAGYFFKCPLCNNKDLYTSEMLTQGIYIPEQDASWEMDPNAFQDLLHRHDRCDKPVCLCSDGRLHDSVGSRWEIILCAMCGHQGCHIACGRLSFYKPYWECSVCQEILNTKKRPKKMTKARKRKSEEIDVQKSNSVVLDSTNFTAVPKAWTSNQIMERICQCQSELKSNFELLESMSSSDESVSSDKPEIQVDILTTSVTPDSTSITSTVSEQKSAYMSDSDDEFDVVVLKDPTESGTSSGSDVDIEGEVKLRLCPSDFPSPFARKLAIHKSRKHHRDSLNPNDELGPQEIVELSSEVQELSDEPQITSYVVVETIDNTDPSTISPALEFPTPNNDPGANLSRIGQDVSMLNIHAGAASGDRQLEDIAVNKPAVPLMISLAVHHAQPYLLETPENCATNEPHCIQLFPTDHFKGAEGPYNMPINSEPSCNPADLESKEIVPGYYENMEICEKQFDRLSWGEGNPNSMLEHQFKNNRDPGEMDVALVEDETNSSTDFTMEGLEIGSLMTSLDYSINHDDNAGSNYFVCLSNDKSIHLDGQASETGVTSQGYHPKETSKENQNNETTSRKRKKSKKKKRHESRNEKKMKQMQDGGDAEKCQRKRRKMQRYLKSLEVGGLNKPQECTESSLVCLETLTGMVEEQAYKPPFDDPLMDLPHCQGSSECNIPLLGNSRPVPVCPTDSREMKTSTESIIEVDDVLLFSL